MNYQLYTDNQVFYKSLLAQIQRSKYLIYIEVFIVSDGDLVDQILEACMKKSKEGVRVVLTVDGYGFCHSTLKNKIKKTNVSLIFHKKFRFLSLLSKKITKLNRRNHKKIYIVDDRLLVGSVNLEENHFDKSKEYKDIMVSMAFDCKNALEKIDSKNNTVQSNKAIYDLLKGEDFYLLLNLADHSQYRKRFYSLISEAKENITLCSPYFNLSRKMLRHLIEASHRGVKVKLYVPSVTDYILYNSFLRCYFSKEAIKNSFEIHFTKMFLHSKLYVFDNLSLIASQNMNYRSLYYDEEIVFVSKDKDLNSQINNMLGSLKMVKSTAPVFVDKVIYIFFKKLRWFF